MQTLKNSDCGRTGTEAGGMGTVRAQGFSAGQKGLVSDGEREARVPDHG